ncbi:50S ribosomal protein L10 [Candidatus Woesearchaeota archaeon]|nr:50S ribosomal protein L10 [Candidatus Woesearchaeota archaeon]
MSEKTHRISEKKKKIAEGIQKLILDHPIIAAVDLENLPAPQLQQMRSQLTGKIRLSMTKRRVIKHAIEGIKEKKKNIEQLEPYLKGMPALIFTKENPFSLFKTLKKSKTSAPAKAGQTAPFDIIVPKGPTGFMPGPVIGELAQLGIKSGVEGGKVAIKEDSVVVKEGEKISAKAAEILARLGIEPMEVGLNVTAVYENEQIFTKDVLDIDEGKFRADLDKAVVGAFNLAINVGYPTKDTIIPLIGKAFNEAKALGLSQEIIDDGIIDALLSKAESSALSLKSTANIAVVEKPKEEKAKEDDANKPSEPKSKGEPAVKEQEKKESVAVDKEDSSSPESASPIEKKEEKVLEEEKSIIQEEKNLEKDFKKPVIQDPVEKEVKEELREEEEKLLEKERIEKEKELEKVEKQKKEEAKRPVEDDTDKKIAEMVAKTKKFVKGEIPDAEKLVEEAGKLTAKEAPNKSGKGSQSGSSGGLGKKGENKPAEKIPSIQELKAKKERDAKESEKKKKEQENVENLTHELMKKGTLRADSD